MRSLATLMGLALVLSCNKPAVDTQRPAIEENRRRQPHIVSVNIWPNGGKQTAGDTTQLCAFIIWSDNTVHIGVPSDTTAARKVFDYCKGAPLTQFRSTRSL